uniref:Uncharacterized protein n=1 Tax=Knipowitschia caucasica TaxID=637954 RepID=A0AAV2K751_KNICA
MSQGLHLLGHKEKILEYKYKPDADKSENENIEVPAEEVQRETDPEDNDEPAAPLQPADANEGEEDEPEVRRSTRARRPPQMFTYNSLGQPTFQFQPPPAVHAVEAFLPPAVPFWGMDPNSVIYCYCTNII